jgi:ABC-type transport system involved in cytochrome c biogenesis permease subunit
VYFSVTWWRTLHPGPVVTRNALPPEMLATFLFTMVCTLVLAAVMIAIRYRIETLTDEKQNVLPTPRILTARSAEAVR